MNKKYSTLCAGLILASAVGASVITKAGSSTVNANIKLEANSGTYNENVYQLQIGGGDSVLYVGENDTLKVVDAPAAADSLMKTLWCVAVFAENNGQNPTYMFKNKGTDKLLSIDLDPAWDSNLINTLGDTVTLGNEIYDWAFSRVYANGVEKMPVLSYLDGSVAVGLKKDGAYMRPIVLGADTATANLDSLTLKVPARIQLNSAALNSMNADDESFNLGFYKGSTPVEFVNKEGRNGNVFGQTLYAVGDTLCHDTTYVYLAKKSQGVKSYIYVDKSYINENGVLFLRLKDDKSEAAFAADTAAGGTVAEKYMFNFRYNISADSLVISVRGAEYKIGGAWTFTHNTDSLCLSVQDLDEGNWLTLGKDTLATQIKLGLGSCAGSAAESNRVSVETGLYTIYSKTLGKYLASPLYENGTTLDWTVVDASAQSIAHMPAYQWAIENLAATDASDDFKSKARIKITNREYPDFNGTVQLYEDKDGKIYVSANAPLLDGATDLVIEKIDKTKYPEAYDKADLGYYKRDEQMSTYELELYSFKYFHPYALETPRYLTVGSDTDSLLYANDTDAAKASRFRLAIGKKDLPYGITNTALLSKVGIKQLKRTSYIVKQGEAVMDSIKEAKYAMARGVVAGEVDTFFFKENNHYNGEHYFTFVKAVNNKIAYTKAGVDEQLTSLPLGAQKLSTEKTSAFAISINETPLYRRFNNETLGEAEPVDSLLFYDYIRGEYLMDEYNDKILAENNVLDYAGIWTKDKADGKLAFRVEYLGDASRLKGPNGPVKPQYLISVGYSKYKGEDAVDCPLNHGHVDVNGNPTTADKCSHATAAKPAFERAKYMVSFADSVELYKGDKDKVSPFIDNFKGYTRVGFVEGIRMGNDLIILPAAYRGMADEDIDIAKLKEEDKALTDAGEAGFIHSLAGDAHKNYTWSFRYINPEKQPQKAEAEGPVNSFLIESMSYNKNAVNIAPDSAAWLKQQNGFLLLTDSASTFENAKVGGDGALVFNVDQKTESDDMATDNETVTASTIRIIPGQGQVEIVGAAAKTVVISNLLGQEIVKKKISSDSELVNVPAGMVLIAVDGEKAVKAVIK